MNLLAGWGTHAENAYSVEFGGHAQEAFIVGLATILALSSTLLWFFRHHSSRGAKFYICVIGGPAFVLLSLCLAPRHFFALRFVDEKLVLSRVFFLPDVELTPEEVGQLDLVHYDYLSRRGKKVDSWYCRVTTSTGRVYVSSSSLEPASEPDVTKALDGLSDFWGKPARVLIVDEPHGDEKPMDVQARPSANGASSAR